LYAILALFSEQGRNTGAAMKILVIDDNDSLVVSVSKILRSAGHDVAVAHDGEEGLSAFREDCPNLVICDLVMPNRGGLSVINQISREAPAVKIIAMTGSGDVDSLAAALESGADEIIAKPFDKAILLGAIKTVCR
jgi:DNA-binding response OmpR family regulator